MTESWFRRELLTPRRLAFNVIFYGLHFFFFGYGWHSQVCAVSFAYTSTSYILHSTGSEHEARRLERPQMVRLGFPRSGFSPRLRRWPYSRTDAAQHYSRCPSATDLVIPGRREHLVPSAGSLLDGILGDGAHHCALHQLLQRRAHPCVYILIPNIFSNAAFQRSVPRSH